MSEKKRITIKDIARLAHVSSYTVSRILSGEPEASKKTQERVLQVVKKLHYKPNPIAQSMRRKTLKNVTILLPFTRSRGSNPYFDQLLKGINDRAVQKDYYVFVVIENEEKNKQPDNFYHTVNSNPLMDNLIVIAPDQKEVRKIKRIIVDKRIVLLNARDNKLPYITIDNYKVMVELVDFLIRKGHRSIAYLNTPYSNYDVEERLQGYSDALKNNGLTVNESLIMEADFSYESVSLAIAALLKQNKKISAIVTFSDLFAIYVLSILYKKGIKVPQKIAVTGFDNILHCNLTIPSLTTVDQPLYDMGQAAFDLVTSNDRFKCREFNGRIIYRESV